MITQKLDTSYNPGGNHLKYSDQTQNFKVKDRSLENSDSYTSKRRNKQIEVIMNKYQGIYGS